MGQQKNTNHTPQLKIPLMIFIPQTPKPVTRLVTAQFTQAISKMVSNTALAS
jgi:hypothetical protein